MERFEANSNEYKNEILPAGVKTFVIEASASLSWYKYVKDKSYMFTIDEFGKSGNKESVLDYFGFTVENIEKRIEEKLNEK